jgi:hypothetical protein
MTATGPPPVEAARGGGTYRRVLGDAWTDLHPAVRAAHLDGHDGAPVRGAGRFRVEHGPGRLARLLANLLRMPAAGEDVLVTLEITADGAGERWRRTMGRSRIVTTQRQRGAGVLTERFGLLALDFRLWVEEGGLVYQQVGAGLELASARLPLPRALSPLIEAWEMPAGPRETRERVRVTAPLVGTLITYEGWLKTEKTTEEVEP